MIRRFLASFLLFLACLVAMPYTLVIDAGHGGKDPGAMANGAKEKNINLAVALAFGKLVEQNCKDVKVVYTRKTDVFVELNERARIANKAKADLFISIHTNATAAKVGPQGTETYTLGMHRAADNLAVAKRENSVITLENDGAESNGYEINNTDFVSAWEIIADDQTPASDQAQAATKGASAKSPSTGDQIALALILVLLALMIASIPIATQSMMFLRGYVCARISSLLMPFITEMITVSGPTAGFISSTTSSRSLYLTATITRSYGTASSAASI